MCICSAAEPIHTTTSLSKVLRSDSVLCTMHSMHVAESVLHVAPKLILLAVRGTCSSFARPPGPRPCFRDSTTLWQLCTFGKGCKLCRISLVSSLGNQRSGQFAHLVQFLVQSSTFTCQS